MPVAAIILAAGSSRRLGEPKQLVRLQGETLLARTVRLAGEAGLEPVLVVLGSEADRMRVEVDPAAATVVINAEWNHGISTSIRAGLSALAGIAPEAACAMMLSCDQPRLTAAHLGNLVVAAGAGPDFPFVASVYSGVRGIPAVFPRGAFPQLLSLTGDRGARSLLQAPHLPLVEVAFDSGEFDIDLPSDLERFRAE